MMEDDNEYAEECSGCHDDRMTPEEMDAPN